MMRTMARGVFLGILAIAASVLVVTVYQVPQPWRGLLVGWLLLLGTVGVFVLRLVGHYVHYKTVQLNAKQPNTPPAPVRRPRRTPQSAAGSLRIVTARTSAGRARHTLR